MKGSMWHPDVPEHYKNNILTGDARELSKALPDESVDLIFTDPVYDRIDDYRWLAETAARVLKPGGNLAAFVSPDRQVEVANLYANCGLVWCDFLVMREIARRRYNHGRKIVGLYEVVAWASKGRQRLGKYVNNFSFVSKGYIRSDSHHDWEKEPDGIIHWLDRLSEHVVLDPFTGGGTVPAVCKMLGRNWIAFEVDPAIAERARERVANTQPPLFVMPAEQMALTL